MIETALHGRLQWTARGVIPAPFFVATPMRMRQGARMTDLPPAETLPADAPAADMPSADTPPDRLSTDPRSPYFQQALLERGVGIRFKGAERTDVEEYSIGEGWVRVALGKKVDRHGRPLTLKLSGPVEAWFERPAAAAGETASD